jgi:serine protease
MLVLLAVWLCRPRKFAVIFSTLVVITAGAWAQNTIRVPQDVPTIQAGIDAAMNGDTVLVSPGIYVQSLRFNGKNITVTSSDGPATTILDGNGASWVVAIADGEGQGAVLRGFTIRNASPVWNAILVIFSSPIIENNIVTDNPGCPGAIALWASPAAIVRNNTISNNATLCNSFMSAGGIQIDGDGSPEVRGNTIKNNGNPALSGGGGGGIAVSGANGLPTPIISGNTIQGNKAFIGGGIYIGLGLLRLLSHKT